MQNWREITAGPEYLRGISREPDYPDDQDWSDAILDPLMESLGRLVRSCSLLEIALFQALSTLDPSITFEEAERRFRAGGTIHKLRDIAPGLHPVRIRNVRGPVHLVDLLDKADECLGLRNGVVHGRPGRKYMSDVVESRRWVKGQIKTTTYTRDRLLSASSRAGNVASDVLAGLEAGWGDQLSRERQTMWREQRARLGSHKSSEHFDEAGDSVLHAVSNGDTTVTLCGEEVLEVFLLPHGDPAQRQPLIFEDSNDQFHCNRCHELAGFTTRGRPRSDRRPPPKTPRTPPS
jgi:hypothetical protein